MLQGGIKVIVTGSWGNNSNSIGSIYQVLFDRVTVPTEAVQPGVLRCHAPGKNSVRYVINRGGERLTNHRFNFNT
jgi:hypothetical protein